MMAAASMEGKAAAAVMGTAPAAVRGAGQRPTVLSLRWRQVASVAEKRAADVLLAMAEAAAVIVVVTAVAVAARRRLQGAPRHHLFVCRTAPASCL